MVFTPQDSNGNRLQFQDVTVLDGSLQQRGPGRHAVIRVEDTTYSVYGIPCTLPHCYCDALVLPGDGPHLRSLERLFGRLGIAHYISEAHGNGTPVFTATVEDDLSFLGVEA